ncbi:MAG: serpin family protein [Calditerrivibrio sp.]|nr:serpin family protein [Calditerrivibrio sp.]
MNKIGKMVIIVSILLLTSINMLWAEISNVVEANNRFSFDIYSLLSKEKSTENIFLSPLSISTAIAMTYEGARGGTAKEIQKVFYFPIDNQKLREGYLSLINEINKKDKKYQLHTANALWVEKKYNLLDNYLKNIEKYYQGKATNVGFWDPSERDQTRLKINKWIEEQTNNKIRELLKPESISQDTKLILTNAIYFKGKWKKAFNKSLTKDEDFKICESKKIKVPMMSLNKQIINELSDYPEFRYTETEDLQVLELPYEGDDVSMLILLPKGNIKDAEKTFNYDRLKELKKTLSLRPVEVYLPKFKFEKEYQLKSTLMGMGMPAAFSDLSADFSGMDGSTKLKIGNVIHKTFIEVDEEGTEAAGATAVLMIKKTSVKETKKPIIFRADRPFIIIIQHNKTGAIMFIGRVFDPSR